MDDIPTVEVADTPNPDTQTTANNASNEVEMGGTQETPNPQSEVTEKPEQTAKATAPEDTILIDEQNDPEPPTPAKKSGGFKFLDFLTAPMVEIYVGRGEKQTKMTAHQTLLLESPFLSAFVDKFDSSSERRIDLPDEDVEAFGCFLQFGYTRDYTISEPQSPAASEEPDGVTDRSGEELLRHARIYTLAEKLGLPALKNLAHTKIHRVDSTPHGELSYARYVYTHTSRDDTMIRRPVASYWASKGHLLRHEVREAWDSMCLEVPEFTTDVLKILMDRKEKTGSAEAESTPEDGNACARERWREDLCPGIRISQLLQCAHVMRIYPRNPSTSDLVGLNRNLKGIKQPIYISVTTKRLNYLNSAKAR